MMHTVHIDTSRPYDVRIGPGLMPKAGELMQAVIKPCCAAIVTDPFGVRWFLSLPQHKPAEDWSPEDMP